MDILIAEDDLVSRRLLADTLVRWDYPVRAAVDGAAAWDMLQQELPALAILDWMMPHYDGPEITRRLRTLPNGKHTYVILLTARDCKSDLVTGLEAGADDYIVKPFDRNELKARVRVGMRMSALQQSLAERVCELEAALSRVQQLQGLLPMCSYCRRVRDDRDYWQQVEQYVCDHTGARFSHGICPACFDVLMHEGKQAV